MDWAIEGLSDLAKQGFMRGQKAKRPKRAEPPIVACDECRDWHRKGKHSKGKAERAAIRKARAHADRIERLGQALGLDKP